MTKNSPRALLVLIALGVVAALYSGAQRYRAESRNRAVEIAIDLIESKRLAAISHRPIPAILLRLRAAGATSVGIAEETFDDLVNQGALRVESREGAWRLTAATPALARRIADALTDRGFEARAAAPAPSVAIVGAGDPAAAPFAVFANADYPTLRTLGVGLNPADVELVRAAGLIPVARIGNFPGAAGRTIAAVLSRVRDLGVATVVCNGTEVLGFRGKQEPTADAFRQVGMRWGQVEFGKQKGDERLAQALKGELMVRVHSISDSEMGMLEESEGVERFVRAARERNIRLCYVRILTTAGVDPVASNADYLQKIVRGIVRGGEMAARAARPYDAIRVPAWAFLLMGLGAGAALALLARRLWPVGGPAGTVLAAACVVGAAGLALAGEAGHRLAALIAAVSLPALALLRPEALPGASAPRRTGGAIAAACLALIAASGVTLCGAALVIGLLASRPFMLHIGEFMGIKAAHGVPIAIVGFLAIAGLPAAGRPWSEERVALRERLRVFFSEPIRVGALILGVVAIVALAMALARTGNEPGVGVSGVELKLRSLLDRFLPIRPRTKEFLVGHPAMFIALALAYMGRRKWAAPLLVVGAIGQVSLLNTFCHIHTPIRLSIIRAVCGLVIGAAIGAGALLAGRRWIERGDGGQGISAAHE